MTAPRSGGAPVRRQHPPRHSSAATFEGQDEQHGGTRRDHRHEKDGRYSNDNHHPRPNQDDDVQPHDSEDTAEDDQAEEEDEENDEEGKDRRERHGQPQIQKDKESAALTLQREEQERISLEEEEEEEREKARILVLRNLTPEEYLQRTGVSAAMDEALGHVAALRPCNPLGLFSDIMSDHARKTPPAVRQAKLLRHLVGPSVRRGAAAAAAAAAAARLLVDEGCSGSSGYRQDREAPGGGKASSGRSLASTKTINTAASVIDNDNGPLGRTNHVSATPGTGDAFHSQLEVLCQPLHLFLCGGTNGGGDDLATRDGGDNHNSTNIGKSKKNTTTTINNNNHNNHNREGHNGNGGGDATGDERHESQAEGTVTEITGGAGGGGGTKKPSPGSRAKWAGKGDAGGVGLSGTTGKGRGKGGTAGGIRVASRDPGRSGGYRASWRDVRRFLEALCQAAAVDTESTAAALAVLERQGRFSCSSSSPPAPLLSSTPSSSDKATSSVAASTPAATGRRGHRWIPPEVGVDFGRFVAAVKAVLLFEGFYREARKAFLQVAGRVDVPAPLDELLVRLFPTDPDENGGGGNSVKVGGRSGIRQDPRCFGGVGDGSGGSVREAIRARLDVGRRGETQVRLSTLTDCILSSSFRPPSK